MVISKKIGHISTLDGPHKKKDYVHFEWYETNKRILHKTSMDGTTVRIKFLNENPDFKEGDVLWETENTLGLVQIISCECLVVRPRNQQELAALCYEIGNQHLPLFMEGEELLVAFEKPLYRYLTAIGYEVKKEQRKLLNALKTTVAPHGNNKSLFTKIMQLTQSKS